jgi:hypothetical protein
MERMANGKDGMHYFLMIVRDGTRKFYRTRPK